MKNKKALLVSSMLMAFALTTTAGISALAETVSVGTTPSSINVVKGLASSSFKVTDYEGNALGVTAGDFPSSDFDYSLHNLNDGYTTSWSAIAPKTAEGAKTLGWFSVDLGATMVIDKIVIDMQHDWHGKDFVLQVAMSADFSDATTIYNNDIDNSLGLGSAITADSNVAVNELLHNNGANDNGGTDKGGNVFNFSPVAGRYVRVTNNQFGNGSVLNYTAIGEIEVYAYEIPSVNVVRSLSTDAFSVTDYNGNPIEHVLPGNNVDTNSFDYTFKNLNDGYATSWSAIVPSVDGTSRSLGWFNVDLGEEHTITKLMVSMQHDWEGQDTVIQLAKSADFSDAITVYSNDIDNSLKLGAATVANVSRNTLLDNFGSAGQTTENNGNYFHIAPTQARYVRVTNNQYGDATLQNYTAIGEIEVYASTGDVTTEKHNEVSPVGFSQVSGTYGNAFTVELASAQADAEIYYTLDGSVPTTNSTKYTGAINVPMYATTMIRAAACVDGVLGLPTTAQYVTQDPNLGKNIALNKPVTIKSLDMTQDWTDQLIALNRDTQPNPAYPASMITDGSFNIWDALYTGNLGRGWAIIDLGAEYYIDYIVYEAYWDWGMANNVIQMANNPDFSDAVTVWEYAGSLQTGVASGQNGMTVDIGAKGRYIRVTNDKDAGGTISSWTEIQAIVGKEPAPGSVVGQNVALNKPVTVKSMDMSEDWTDSLRDVNQGSTIDTAEQYVTDGQFDFWHAIATDGKGQGWFVIDLGENYWMDRILYDAYWDWDVSGHEIQIAKSADFSDAVTVWSHTDALQTRQGKEIKFNPVEGRYIRVTNYIRNNVLGGDATVVTELQAFACEAPEGEPVTEKAYLASYEKPANVTVANGTALEDIQLPAEITATLSDGTTKAVAGTWSVEGYATVAGTYTAIFTATDASDAFGLLKNVEITITVEKVVPTISVEVTDRYVADGNAPTVTVNASMDYVVEYYAGEEKLTEAPTTAGEYKVVAIIAETDNNVGATAEKTFIIVDYRALNAKLSEVATLEQATYTTASWTAFANAKTSAQAVADNAEATQTAIDEALNTLTTAATALVVKADFTALASAVEAAEAVVLDNYISAGKSAFTTALATAQAALANDATAQADVDAAKTALESAQSALVLKGDLTALQTAVEAAEAVVLDNYISTGKSAFTTALAAAQAIITNNDSAQADIDAAKAALESAQSALVLKGDKTELNGLLTEVGALVEADYTEETWAALAEAKAEAEAVASNDDAVQADVDAAVEALTAARAALANKPKTVSCGSTAPMGTLVMLAALCVAKLLKKKED